MVQSNTEQDVTVSSQETAEVAAPLYSLDDIVFCMRISAKMLELAGNGNDKNYWGQATLLRAAAEDLKNRMR
jgi:hypothetical protein